MRDLIFITFDIRKDDYPPMPYSIASIIASIKSLNLSISHYSIDLQHVLEEKEAKRTLTEMVHDKIVNNANYFKSFRFIAISCTSWSIDYCFDLMSLMDDYKGTIIFGGYEVTSRKEQDLVELFPRVDYFIKGYAETAIKKILLNKINSKQKVIKEPTNAQDLVSPYLNGIINLISKKIHWETKRGCPHRCGFCEWGNEISKVVHFDKDRLLKEIELFKSSAIEEINILDGTFIVGKQFLELFRKLLETDNIKITCQAHFSDLIKPAGQEFLRLCIANRKRIHLEFGLQTIHQSEMNKIGRKNEIASIQESLKKLNEASISYEVSIIYAIPGQTISSFIETIEFLIDNGCKKIMAFPLMIPKNSKLHEDRFEDCILEGRNKYNVASVVSSSSFPIEQRRDMDRIVQRLHKGELHQIKKYKAIVLEKSLSIHQISYYQFEIKAIQKGKSNISKALISRIIEDFFSPTIQEIRQEDFRQALILEGGLYQQFQANKTRYINDTLAGSLTFELKKLEIPEESRDNLIKAALSSINKELREKKFHCKAHLGRSGNIYVFREINYQQ